jgi:dTDP-4-amino-4,6-dideoxygalactose transaminase
MDRMLPFKKPIYVTRPFLPPLEEFCEGLKDIWENEWLTNNGPILKEFEKQLSEYFDSENICLFNNGTLALQIALQGMNITGEVITTPFTFIATTHALYWNNIKPVFVDIEAEYYTLDPQKVEDAITPNTTAILPVHVYGHPCNHEALADIAKRHNIKLIYDAAHTFGVKVNGNPIALFGDLSMFSFHSTKLFHSIEGGMLIFKNSNLKEKFNYLKNFGFKNEIEVVMPGTNAKMNEFQALMGLKVLKYFPTIVKKRRSLYYTYKKRLKEIPGISPAKSLPPNVDYNYSYYPVEIDKKISGISRDELYEQLKKYNVFTRRYFYPLVNDMECYKKLHSNYNLKNAREVSKKILTLPIYHTLDIIECERICDIIHYLVCRN